jgi:DMSO/TMAO reductase YedYZ molybdopterin-dependent catalytic subunit
MTDGIEKKLKRRELLQSSLIAGGMLLLGFEKLAWAHLLQPQIDRLFAGGKLAGVIDFAREANVPMEKVLGAELDGRLYTDLSNLAPERARTPTESFYIRTRASELLPNDKTWGIKFGGLVAKLFELSMAELKKMAKPMGLHLMECAGNDRRVHFGLMSAAEWTGVPLSEILENAKAKPEGTRILISGFDTYRTKSMSSLPGASWIFSREELISARAFLATEMNGSALTKDHGAPVRLIVPGWYGCACIKWVNEIAFTDDMAPATTQMQEYATRTMQIGVPRLAREYQPARIEPAAMPIRIEKWLVGEKTRYRVVGILWGGARVAKDLEIRFNPEEDYVPVDSVEQSANDSWSFWSHAWMPKQTGTFMLRLRVKDAGITARRLEAGYYMRTVEIQEI